MDALLPYASMPGGVRFIVAANLIAPLAPPTSVLEYPLHRHAHRWMKAPAFVGGLCRDNYLRDDGLSAKNA